MSTLLEEVARLVAAGMGIPPAEPMTEEQAAEFRKHFAEEMAKTPQQYKWLSPKPALTEDEVRQLLRECVTVVKPGETLIIRADENWTPNVVRELQDSLDAAIRYRDLGFSALIVPGEELGVAEAAGGD